MPTIRVHKTNDFTVMSNRHLRERGMTLKAKGLLSFMLSLPENWDYSVDGLTKCSKDGKDSVTSALMELESFGYLVRKQVKDNGGKFSGYGYDVYEIPMTDTPLTEKPLTENPLTENPLTENPQQINTNILNTNILSTNNIIKEEESAQAVTIDTVIDSQKECLRKPLREFVKMRKAIKKPLTTYGLSLLLGNLFKLASTDEEQVKIIEQSILNGWQGIFPLSKEHSERQQRRGEGKNAAEFPQREYSREDLNLIFQYEDGGEL